MYNLYCSFNIQLSSLIQVVEMDASFLRISFFFLCHLLSKLEKNGIK